MICCKKILLYMLAVEQLLKFCSAQDVFEMCVAFRKSRKVTMIVIS